MREPARAGQGTHIRPILYGTTNKFLRAFNISDLTELPKFQEFSMKEMTDINEIE